MIQKLWDFFFRDAVHVLAGCVLFVAVILSVFTGITHGISICVWAAAVLCLVFARLCDAREAKWMEDTVDVTATVENIQKVHLMVHMSATHYANEDAISPYVIVYRYQFARKEYQGRSQWLWFNQCFPKGMKIPIQVSASNPKKKPPGKSRLRVMREVFLPICKCPPMRPRNWRSSCWNRMPGKRS